MVGSTQFPIDEETQKCIGQMSKPIDGTKPGAWLRECRQQVSLSRVEEEDREGQYLTKVICLLTVQLPVELRSVLLAFASTLHFDISGS